MHAANNTIAGYTLRQNTRLKRRDELQEKIRELTSRLDSVTAKTRVLITVDGKKKCTIFLVALMGRKERTVGEGKRSILLSLGDSRKSG